MLCDPVCVYRFNDRSNLGALQVYYRFIVVGALQVLYGCVACLLQVALGFIQAYCRFVAA